ncbi:MULTISPECIES: QueT transporter family protein [Tissierellales]|jgi:uncharacterized membrane protein|uniref:QueT transporter family protein n=1 Tax=Acidilutibacter cellobiosedens TaxID=2507161 RepID=A0A410QH09_9FIRM|nr:MULTISPECIES: QueT transporter family protein [Tissierellales]MBE6081216.1 QueT transporter family protein [Tissierellaceae bacterium]QAT63261.1 QueT transporter family protein [Acidilutibacter cellobiosedens]SCL95880.1 putative membrane protein [Sporanaerobacter sp. PP17-6a]
MKIKSNTQKIAISGVFMALYIVLMYFTQNFAFGQYQIRIATSLYAFAGVYPFLILPMGIGNMVSNMIMGGLGIFDIIGGLIVGIVTTSGIYMIKRFNLNDWFIALPIIFGPGLIVPIWLSFILNVPYKILAVSLCTGQVIPSIVGVIMVKEFKKRLK